MCERWTLFAVEIDPPITKFATPLRYASFLTCRPL